jgi:hypothetical protein
MQHYISRVELANKLAIEHLRTEIAQQRLEMARLIALVEIGATQEIRASATSDLQLITGRIRNQLNELTRLETS